MEPDHTLEISNESCNRLLREVSERIDDAIRMCGEKQVHDLRVAYRYIRERGCDRQRRSGG